MNIKSVIRALEKNRYSVNYFETAQRAADYIDEQIDNQIVGFGDSATMNDMKLYKRLSEHNTVYDPNQSKDNDEFIEIAMKTLTAEVYLTSVNAMSETGEMVNIDGTGNRVAGSLFGHNKVYFIVSTNKIVPTLEDAVYRARNVAAPKNAKRYNLKTPCAVKGDRCYNCNRPDRICNAMNLYLKKMNDTDDMEIILINEDMGF